MKPLVAATVTAALAGAAAAATLHIGAPRAADTGPRTAQPPVVRTQVVTQTIHRVRRVHVRRPPASAPAPAPVQAPATRVAAATPAAAPAPPPPAAAPVRTRSSGAGEHEGDHEVEAESGEHEDD